MVRFPPIIILLGGLAAAAAGLPARAAVDHGEILLNQLSCTQCHEASTGEAGRLPAHEAPRLGQEGIGFTPQWLRAFLANPAAVHPGTVMPDMLHGLAPEQKAKAIEDLTQYLVSLQPPAAPDYEWDAAAIAKGRDLYHSVGCVACHAPFEMPPRIPEEPRTSAELEQIRQESAAFPDLPRMTTVPRLAAFLRDPVRFHPDGRMPSSRLGDAEATAIAAYLLRGQAPADAGKQRAAGLKYEYFERTFSNLPNFDRLAAAARGISPGFDLSAHQNSEHFAIRFAGNLTIPTEGEYQFFTKSHDGSELLIDGKKVVDNDGVHPMREAAGRIVLQAGDHSMELLYFDRHGAPGLQVSWQVPGAAKEEIPASALSHSGALLKALGDAPFTADAAGIERGKQLFASLNCAACHQPDQAAAHAKPLAGLASNRTDDCLSATPAAGLPKYILTDDDRAAIRRTLQDPAHLAKPLEPGALIEQTMTLLNCYACHNRDQRGGAEGLRREYFTSSPPDLDLGDEGRIPPHLTGVGAKLQLDWMGKVLWQGASVRPYMAARMPQFGKQNVEFLPAAFQAADAGGVRNPDLLNQAPAGSGRKLVGLGGLGCIACHNFENHPSLGIPAMDLTVMTERLQTGWYHRYLIDPQSLRPGTRMPSFWPAGKALNRDILKGDTDQQIAAIWTYLSKGKSADFPDGLIHGKMELVADKEAVIYRNFIEGAGPRAIGVGYPEKANLAFDAGQMHIALIWQGSFIDAAQHRTGRGMGYTPPMGYGLLTGPPGAPFALLANPDDPWPHATGKTAGYQFHGYSLDAEQRPAFDYGFDGINIVDYPIGVPGKEDPGLKRTITFTSSAPPDHLYMRAAVGDKIEAQPGGMYVVDGRLYLHFSVPGAAIRQSDGKAELLVPIHFAGNKAALEEDYAW